MEKPTIWSSRPDPMRRTVCLYNDDLRRARYGRIRPMQTDRSFLSRITGIIPIA
jgi:hypothetical protein